VIAIPINRIDVSDERDDAPHRACLMSSATGRGLPQFPDFPARRLMFPAVRRFLWLPADVPSGSPISRAGWLMFPAVRRFLWPAG
jgi:hypothetical protein